MTPTTCDILEACIAVQTAAALRVIDPRDSRITCALVDALGDYRDVCREAYDQNQIGDEQVVKLDALILQAAGGARVAVASIAKDILDDPGLARSEPLMSSDSGAVMARGAR